MTFFFRRFNKKNKFEHLDFKLVHEFSKSFHLLQPIVGYKYDPNLSSLMELNGTYKDFCDMIYKSYKHLSNHSKKANIIIDKNPVNTLHLDKIRRMNPEAQFIFITRDYRANILSRRQSKHIHSTNYIYNALRWNYFMKKAIKFKRNNPSLVHVLKYEDLVMLPEESLQKIFHFLKLPSQLIDLDQSSEKRSIDKSEVNTSNERYEKKYSDLANPISTDRMYAWKRELDSRTIQRLECICQKHGEELGYSPSTTPSLSNNLSTSFLLLPQKIRLNFKLLKDVLTDLLPINVKIARFKKFVSKVESARKSNK